MIDLPDFSRCVEFQRLKEKMGVKVIPILPVVKFTRKITKRKEITEPNKKAIEFDKILKTEIITKKINEISVDDNGLLNIEGTKVVAYIRDQPRGIDFYNKYSTYRYHLCDCRTLRHMRGIGREARYLVTKRNDGLFDVYDTSGYTSRKLTVKLDLCKNCIDELKQRGLWFKLYSLEKYFEKFDSQIPKTIKRIEEVTEIQNYTPQQEDISREYRKAVNYCCQKCGVDCSSYQHLLHLHHKDGDRSNNERSNLNIFCVGCHSKEPMHEHLLYPKSAKEQVEIIKSLRIDQGILDLGVTL